MFSFEAPSEVEGIVDVCIIGAGPAGMTAAVYLARKKRSVAIITKEIGGQVAWTLGIENYMGYQYITGRELAVKFEEQVRQFPVPIVTDEVKGLKKGPEGYVVETVGGRIVEARTLVIASGKRPREMGIPGEKTMIGRGLSYCATCDGPLFAKQHVAVCGGGNSAIQAALEMSQIASKVYVVSRSPWKADPVVTEKIDRLANLDRRIGFEFVEVLGQSKVEGLRIRDKASGKEEVLEVAGVFVEIGLQPNTGFVKEFLKLNEFGEIEVNCRCETDLPGVFAAGDVTNVHEKQIVVSAGEGAKAALSAHEFLMKTLPIKSDDRDTW